MSERIGFVDRPAFPWDTGLSIRAASAARTTVRSIGLSLRRLGGEVALAKSMLSCATRFARANGRTSKTYP